MQGHSGGMLTSEEEEDTPLHAAQHGDEALANDKGEEHVDGHVEGASCCTCLQRLDLTAGNMSERHECSIHSGPTQPNKQCSKATGTMFDRHSGMTMQTQHKQRQKH